TDNGNTYKLYSKSQETTAITLGCLDVIHSYITAQQQQQQMKLPPATSQGLNLNFPALDPKDHILYISQNPQKPAEIVLATIKENVFLTTDDGNT
ncbi:VPS10, VPS10 domain protein, partial [Bacillus pacificus]|nr:VPS10, VPS10 domain protein [Bacillus pacificus]